MRPGQNKRMRGRNNNNNNGSSSNRKGPNPLTRSYESNGPDVKIRGTAHHVAEKYLQLARDAQSSGDPVAAESYLQHAEHYFRLIASAQQAQMGFARQPEEVDIDEGDDDDVAAMPDRFASPPERVPTFTPPQQPSYQERPAYQAERQPYNGERQPGQDRQERGPDRPQERGPDRPVQDRSGQERGGYERQGRGDRQPRQQRPFRDQDNQTRQDGRGQDFRNNREPRGSEPQGGVESRDPARDAPRGEANPREPTREGTGRGDYAPREAYAPREVPVERQPEVARQPDPVPTPDTALPAFITAPVRVTAPPMAGPVSEVVSEASGNSDAAPADAAEDAPRFPVRRRRRTRAAIAADLAEAAGRAADVPSGNE